MRRALTALIAGAMCFALPACGNGGASLDALRERIDASQSLTMTAQVASTTDGRYESYTLECVSGPEGCTVSVLEPAELAGVTASFDAGTGLLSYDSLVLSFETPEDVTPITALPVLVSALRDAYETISWSEGDDTYVSLEATDELSITLRLDADGNPVWAEFLLGGEAVSQCEITQFSISEA